MKKPLAVGDKVRISGWGDYHGRSYNLDMMLGVIDTFAGGNRFNVRCDTPNAVTNIFTVFFSQCRKIVKKERRRIWIRELALLSSPDRVAATIFNQPQIGFLEFIQVKKK